MSHVNNERIAKNTVALYGRTLFMLFISLFTSRITLQALGVNNYGIQSAVGGVIAMFSIISGSLSKSISRFITFELGHGDKEKLQRIFSTAINVQLGIGIFIIFVGETVGVWFLNTQMNIPADRMTAANWVLQCAIWSFFIGLTQTPYGACIVGHEKMGVYAYFGIANDIIRLLIVYLLYVSPYDKLITLSSLQFAVSLLMHMTQRIYCARNFEECHYSFIYDKKLTREMTSFAGWSFLTNAAWIFNTQGLNILINIFFGVELNAARGIAAKIEGYVKKFTGDFTTALNPQITKTYAAGEMNDCHLLICRGAKFSFFLMFCLSLPFMFESGKVLYLWLGIVPDHTVAFFRLSMVASMITLLGHTGVIGAMATGNIKWYTIIITAIGFLVFPLTWIAFKLGFPVESCYVVYIGVYLILHFVRLFILRGLMGFSVLMFLKLVWKPIIPATICAVIFPLIMKITLPDSIINSLLIMGVSIITSLTSSFFLGLTRNEKTKILQKVFIVYQKYQNKK